MSPGWLEHFADLTPPLQVLVAGLWTMVRVTESMTLALGSARQIGTCNRPEAAGPKPGGPAPQK